jgi:hypothetical protein
MLGRKRAVNDWSLSKLMGHIVAAYVTNPELDPVKAAVILDQDPPKLPASVWESARQSAEDEGREFLGIARYVVFLLDFPSEVQEDVQLEGAYERLVRTWEESFDLGEAHSRAAEWVMLGDVPGIQTTFDGLPGLYKIGFVKCIKGLELDLGAGMFMWWVSDAQGNQLMARHWP